MKGKHRRRVGALLAAGAAALAAGGQVWGAITFDATTGAVTITHDSDILNPGDFPVPSLLGPGKALGAVPTAASLNPPPYQLQNTFVSGGSSTVATGSLGQVTNSTTASFSLATGTGVTQTDPGNAAYPGASSLKFDVNLWWNVGSGGFGPLANGYASIATGGTVAAGGSAELHINLSFKNAAGVNLRTPWVVDQVFQPGVLPQVFTTSRVLNYPGAPSATLPAGSRLRLVGTIEFRASNEEAPAFLNALRAEFGGAPPTATFKTDGEGSWLNSGNWEPVDPIETGLLPLANGVGHRALFFGTSGPSTTHSVDVAAPVTLGTLDVDGNTPYAFTGSGSGGFNFSTSQGKAVINMRHVAGESGIFLPVNLSSPVEVITQQSGSLNLGSIISGAGGITKLGTGSVTLNAANNTFSGGVQVVEGVLVANAIGSLGTGPVTVDGGELVYNAPGAAVQDVVAQSGLLTVATSPSFQDRFHILDQGGIGGIPAVMQNLTVGQNLILSPGAMIVHSDPGNLQSGNPNGLENQPLYIFGVAGSFPVEGMTVGIGSGTPWMGIGGSRGHNEFGTDDGVLQLAGPGVVTALSGGSLKVRSQIVGGQGLTKTGGGTVELKNVHNSWTGGLTVNGGTLAAAGGYEPTSQSSAINNNNITLAGGTFRADGILSGQNMLLASFFNNDVGDQHRYLNPIGGGEGLLSRVADGQQEFTTAVRISDQGQTGPDIRPLSRGAISNHENFSVMLTGQLHVSPGNAGLWNWGTTSDDGSVIWIDLNNNGVFENTGNPNTTELIVDNNEYQGPTFRGNDDSQRQGHPNLTLSPGTYNIAIGLYEGLVSGELTAQFRSPQFPSDTVVNPGDPAQADMWSFNNTGDVKYDASYVNSKVIVAPGSSSGIEVNARSATFDTLTLGAGSTLNVTGVGGAHFKSTTATGTVTIYNSQDVRTGVFGGSVSRLNKRGPGRLILDDLSGVSGLSSASTVSVQDGALVARSQGGSNTIGNAAIQLDGGTFVAQGGAGVLNALRGSAHASQDVRVNTNALAGAPLANSTQNYDLLLWGNDPVFNAHFGTSLPDAFTAFWTGEFVALHTGNHYFRSRAGDDNVGLWIDLNQNGVFDTDGGSRNPIAPGKSELVNHWQCCGDSLESVGIFLRAGERYKVAFGVQDTGGGSGFGVEFREPGGTLQIINPAEQPGRWVINAGDAGNTPWLTDVANFGGGAPLINPGQVGSTAGIGAAVTSSPVHVTADSTIDVQAASAEFGALTIDDGATLSVTGVGPATFGNFSATGVVGIVTTMHATVGRITTPGSIAGINKSGEAALILDDTSGASALSGTSNMNVNAGTLVVTTNGINNPLGAAIVTLSDSTSLTLSSKVVTSVSFNNAITATDIVNITAANRGRGAIDGGSVTLNNLAVNGPSTVDLAVNNSYSLNLANVTVAGNVTFNNDSNDTSITLRNLTGGAGSNVLLTGANRTRLTGNVAVSSLTVRNAALDIVAGTGNTSTISAGNTTVSGRLHVQSGTADFGGNTITGNGFVPGLNETWVTNNAFYEAPDISPDGLTRFYMGRQLGLRQANGTNVNTDNGWRLGWTSSDTYIYTGQIFVPDNAVPGDGMGRISIAEQFDDNVLVKIDGVQRLRDMSWNTATGTGVLNLSAGWHDLDIRVGQGGGGAGPSGQAGWPGSFGVVLDSQGRGDVDHTHYFVPVDPGDGSLFRSPSPAAVDIDAGTELKAGRLTSLNAVNLNGSGGVARLTLNSASAMSSDVLALNVNGSGFGGEVNLGSNSTLVASNLNIAAAATLTKTGGGTLTITGLQTHQAGAALVVKGGTVNLNSNPGTPGSAAGSNLALNVTGSLVVLGSDVDLKELVVDFQKPGSQTMDLNSPPGAGAFRSVRVYSADLAAAKRDLYDALQNGKSNFPDGIIDSGLAFHPGGALGLARQGDHIFIRPTRIGDLNLDGNVTINDFIDLASNYNTLDGTATWQEGDLNLDGNVTISDFIDLAANFNSSYSGEAWGINESEARILADFAAEHGEAVPEPGAMGVWLLGMGWVGRRRRAKRVNILPPTALPV